MARYFAKLDSNNIVLEVIAVADAPGATEQDGVAFLTTWSGGYTNWKLCSYVGAIRKQYPGIGYTYDPVADVFVAPQPFPSWVRDANHDWQAPVPYPTDGGHYYWNEPTLSWTLIQ